MVGVPGRSQGCITCRARRKGCDRQRPACLRCIQAGLSCGGYNQRPVFVTSTQGSGGSSARYQRARSSAQDITLSPSLTQTAYSARYLDLFWSHYLPCGETLPAQAMALGNGGWISIALDLFPTDRTLQLAMQSVVLRGVGIRNADPALLRQGLTAHSRCLQDFNTALSDPSRCSTDGILCTVKLLSLFEVGLSIVTKALAARYRTNRVNRCIMAPTKRISWHNNEAGLLIPKVSWPCLP